MMTLFSGRLNTLLAIALAALLALGAVSAFAGPAPDEPGDVVTVDTGNGDTEGDTEGGDSGEVVCGVDGDTEGDTADTASHDGDGPNPDRGCATGSLDHARGVLMGLLERDHPGENEGIQNALDKMCHGFFAEAAEGTSEDSDTEGSGGDESTHPGNGHAFGRGHGHGK